MARAGLMLTGPFELQYEIGADYSMLHKLAVLEEPHNLETTIGVFHRGGLSTTRRKRLHWEFFLVRWRSRTLGIGFYAIDAMRTAKRILVRESL